MSAARTDTAFPQTPPPPAAVGNVYISPLFFQDDNRKAPIAVSGPVPGEELFPSACGEAYRDSGGTDRGTRLVRPRAAARRSFPACVRVPGRTGAAAR